MNKPWKDKDTVEQLYCDEGLTTRELADRLGCGKSTAWRWVKKHGLESHSQTPQPRHPELTDPDELERLYYDENLSQPEIAEKLGCSQRTVSRWMEKHEIETDDRGYTRRMEARRVGRAAFRVGMQGYEEWKDGDIVVRVHRLLAIAEYGVDAVVGKVVHHKNGIPWDNRPDNIELMTNSEHMKLHSRIEGCYDAGE